MPANKRKTKAEDSGSAEGRAGCVVVGIGSSACSPKALSDLVQALEPDTGMAFVVIQHPDNTHGPLAAGELANHTRMDVIAVTDPCAILPNRIYVAPAGKYLAVGDDGLVPSDPAKGSGACMLIDYLFRSLAERCGERAVAIMLSGMGSDGALGLKEIKVAGGLTIAQQPERSEYESMPRSAIATGMIDLIVDVTEMPDILCGFAGHPYIRDAATGLPLLHESSPEHFQSILNILHTRTGYDFSCYKKGTLNRRIQRRMGLRKIGGISRYLEFIRRDSEEVDALFGDMLIGVTRFFRDGNVWEKVLAQVIRPLITGRQNGGAIRIWVPGCSTGEEAYTIAMLVFEEAERQGKTVDLHLFATDIDQAAVSVARSGVYPANIGLDLSKERLARHFNQEGESYRVNKVLRESCIFAAQNLISDPPFSNLDIISCRNLLIYLEPAIQEKLTELFHFALGVDGTLLLGGSESTTKGESLFEPLSKNFRIFRKKKQAGGAKGERFPIMPGSARRPVQPIPKRAGGGPVTEIGTVEFAHKVLLDVYAPASILIGADHSIHYYHGALSPYLNPPSGKPSTDLFANLIKGLGSKVRGLIRAAGQEGVAVRATTQPIRHGGALCAVRISVTPLQPSPTEALFLITFEDVKKRGGTEAAPASDEVPSDEDSTLLRQLEYELLATREDLQSTIEEVEASNEELKAANEEVMSMNEELQSTNEELETSREEFQSLNEELSTLNAQLAEKLDELEASNNDLSNVLTSTRIATIFLDSDLRIRRFTPSCRELLDIIPTDTGRPIGDFSPRLNDRDLENDARMVLEKLHVSEKEVRPKGAGWFLRRILPFRTADNQIEGVVITLTDIDTVKKTHGLLVTREHQQACVARLGQFALSHHGLQEIFDHATRILVDALGVTLTKVLKLNPDGQSLSIVSGQGWDARIAGDGKVPAGTDSQAGFTIQSKGPVVVTNLADETRFRGPELLTNHKVRSGLSVILGPPEEPWGVLGAHSLEHRKFTEDDVNFFRAVSHILTEAIRREAILAELEESRERLIVAQEAGDLGIHDYSVANDLVYWDQRSRDFWGVEPDEPITLQTFFNGIHKDDRKAVTESIDELLDPEGSHRFYCEYRVIHRKDKRVRWIAGTAKSFFRDGKPYRAVGTHTDITRKRNFLEEQVHWAERLEEQVIERTCLAEQRAEDLRLLAAQITTAEERARRKVAQVIHDDIQQLLIAAKMRLPVGEDDLPANDELKVVASLLDRGLAQARSLVSELSPPVQHDGEFDKALAWLAGHMESTHRLAVELKTEGNLEGLEQNLVTLLFNVARELLFNAVKHSGTHSASLLARVDANILEMEVRDSGKGFDVPSRSRETDGFGLFSIEERVSAFGGTMDVESAAGQGARFVIRLPLLRRPVSGRADGKGRTEKAKGHTAAPRGRGERIRILVADDHEVVREGYVKILSGQAGLEVVATASDGEEAVKLALQHQPDLILMDISMPRMNGIEATQAIKANQKETLIIGLSMHEEGILGASMQRAGASAYLQKDVAGSHLLGKIRELFHETDQDP